MSDFLLSTLAVLATQVPLFAIWLGGIVVALVALGSAATGFVVARRWTWYSVCGKIDQQLSRRLAPLHAERTGLQCHRDRRLLRHSQRHQCRGGLCRLGLHLVGSVWLA